jgi:hypothetical protein
MDRLIRTGVRELGDYFRGGQALKMQPPPQPPMYRQWIGGDPNMDPGARLSAFIASRVFAIGALLYPSPLGVGTLTPAERRDEAVRASYNAGNFRMLGLPDAPAPPTYRDPRALPDLLLENIPRRADTGFRGFLRRELGGAGADFGRDWLANQLGVPRGTLPYPAREQGPPEPRVNIGDIHSSPTAQIPDPGTVATPGVQQVNVPSTAPGKRGTFGKGTRARQRIFTFGGLGTAVLLIEAGRRGRSPVPSARPGAPVLPSPLEPPIAIPTPTPLTPQQPSVQSYSPGYYGAAGADGYCIPRKRGPRRKCLERAPVKYSGGRRKGKAAGTKCLRWEAPKR